MRVGGRGLSILALVAMVGSGACQVAAPSAPVQVEPTTITTTPVTPPLATPVSTSQPSPTAALAPTHPAKMTPTSVPTLPVTALGSLPPGQAATVRNGRNALAAGDYPRALSLLEPLVGELTGE